MRGSFAMQATRMSMLKAICALGDILWEEWLPDFDSIGIKQNTINVSFICKNVDEWFKMKIRKALKITLLMNTFQIG